MTNDIFKCNKSDAVIRCQGRQSEYDVILSSSRLCWRRKLMYRPIGVAGICESRTPKNLLVEVVRERSIMLGIPFALRISDAKDESDGFVFFPRNPGNWLTALEEHGARIEDAFDIRRFPARTWLCNHIEFLPMLVLLPMLLGYCLFLAIRLAAT